MRETLSIVDRDISRRSSIIQQNQAKGVYCQLRPMLLPAEQCQRKEPPISYARECAKLPPGVCIKIGDLRLSIRVELVFHALPLLFVSLKLRLGLQTR